MRQEVLDLLSAVGRAGGARVALEVVETMGMDLSDLTCGRPRCAVPRSLIDHDACPDVEGTRFGRIARAYAAVDVADRQSARAVLVRRVGSEVVGPTVSSDGA
ncbi:hypothetical protein SsS58_00409 [Streptomyces scabiei]|uniref:Uncharacterized protein n=1 Tax=Streptomyces scabiei TaxID=1930 RepID=A0A100JIB3_STRSC|nr:hypothetical protein SsS58_00409 [Streptomyces scabiei]